MTNSAQDLISVGRVTRPHGIVGEVKVELAPEFAGALDDVRRVHLDGSDLPHRVLARRAHQGAMLLRLERVTTRNDAEALRGARVSIRLKDLPDLPTGQFYAHDLMGLRVQRESGELLGELTEVLATGSNDVYVVRTTTGELLLPALESVIRNVNMADRVMTVAVPDGLE